MSHPAVSSVSALSRAFSGSRWSDSNRRPAVYETAALPLSYTGLWSPRRDSNPGPQSYQDCALPPELRGPTANAFSSIPEFAVSCNALSSTLRSTGPPLRAPPDKLRSSRDTSHGCARAIARAIARFPSANAATLQHRLRHHFFWTTETRTSRQDDTLWVPFGAAFVTVVFRQATNACANRAAILRREEGAPATIGGFLPPRCTASGFTS